MNEQLEVLVDHPLSAMAVFVEILMRREFRGRSQMKLRGEREMSPTLHVFHKLRFGYLGCA